MSIAILQQAIQKSGVLSNDEFVVAATVASFSDASGDCRASDDLIASKCRVSHRRVREIRQGLQRLTIHQKQNPHLR